MLQVIRAYNKDLKNIYSSIEKRKFRWLQILIVTASLGIIITFINNCILYFIDWNSLFFNTIEYTGLSSIILFLLFMVLNLHLKQNFHQFVNNYRIEHACLSITNEMPCK